MELVFILGLMGKSIWEIERRARWMGLEFFNIEMGKDMKEIGEKERNMEKESLWVLMG